MLRAGGQHQPWANACEREAGDDEVHGLGAIVLSVEHTFEPGHPISLLDLPTWPGHSTMSYSFVPNQSVATTMNRNLRPPVGIGQ